MNENPARIALVTGATGFVGSHLVRRLVGDGWQVHTVGRVTTSADNLARGNERVVAHCHDGTTENLIEIVGQVQPEVVFHLASLFVADHRPQDVESLLRSNVIFGGQLLEAMKQARVTQLVNTGTSWQHFEDRDYSPVCLYAATKQAFEAILQFYCETTGLRAITLKLYDTYGPDDPRPKLFNLLDRVAREQMVLLMSPGEQLLDLVYIDDVVDAFSLATEHLKTLKHGDHEAYAVTSQAPIRLKELVAIYGRTRGAAVPIHWGGRPYRLREVMMPWSRGVMLPGWQPRVGLADGFARMVENPRQESDYDDK